MLRGGLVAGGAAALSLAGAFALAAKRGVDVQLQLQRSESTFTLLFKSMDAGRRTMQVLAKEASSSAYELTTLSEAGELLASFGFREAEILPWLRALGDAAGGSTEKLMGIVTAVGQIKAKGKLQAEELMQLQERGLPTRELLGLPQGVDPGNSGMTSEQGLQRLLAGIQGRYGGRQAAAMDKLPGVVSNVQDAVSSITSQITRGLLPRLNDAAKYTLNWLNSLDKLREGRQVLHLLDRSMSTVGEAIRVVVALFTRLATSPQIAEAIITPFRVLGNITRIVGSNIEGVARRIERFFAASEMRSTIAAVLSLIVTLGQQLAKVLGVDLEGILNGSVGLFETFGKAVGQVVLVAFGLGRVFKEVSRAVQSAFVDMGDVLKDQIEDVQYSFQRAFLAIQRSGTGAFEQILRTMAKAAQGMPPALRQTLGLDPAALNKAADSVQMDNEVLATADDNLFFKRTLTMAGRGSREANKRVEDPYRGEDINKRIGDAFMGDRTGVLFEKEFRAQLQKNFAQIYSFLFGDSGDGMFGADAAQRDGGAKGRGGSVSGARGGPLSPSNDPNDPFRPVQLPNGSTTTAVAAMARRLPFMEMGQAPGRGVGMPGAAAGAGGAAGNAPGGAVTVNMPLAIVGRPDLSDPKTRAEIHRQVDIRIDEVIRQQIPSPGY
ncbi:MAG: tape measure protein [Actinomycetota bacterium]